MRSISAGGQPCIVDSVTEWIGLVGMARQRFAARAAPSAPKAFSNDWCVDGRPRFGDGRLPDRGAGGRSHAFDESVHPRALDAVEGVADGHVEHQGSRLARPSAARKDVDRYPGAQVFGAGLVEEQFGRPFDVVPLVERVDAGLLDVEPVVLLYGLELEDAGAGQPGGDDVRRYLGMRTGGRSDRQADAQRR